MRDTLSDTLTWQIHSPLYGERTIEGSDAVILEECPFREMALVASTRDTKLDAKKALQLEALPLVGCGVITPKHLWLWTAPNQWLVIARDDEHPSTLVLLLREHMKGFYVSDQTSGRVHLRLKGNKSRAVLTKLCDLDDDVFSVGRVALTNLGHINALLYRDDIDSFDIWVFSSFARSLWHDIVNAGQEYAITTKRFYD